MSKGSNTTRSGGATTRASTVVGGGNEVPINIQGQNTPMIDWGGRKIVMVDINGVKVPFYLSTGLGGKTDVPSGKWYPFFGIDPDGWMNKTEGIADYYNSPELKSVAESLDRKYGDIRESGQGLKIEHNFRMNFSQIQAMRKAVNQDVHRLPDADYENEWGIPRPLDYHRNSEIYDRIERIKQAIKKK